MFMFIAIKVNTSAHQDLKKIVLAFKIYDVNIFAKSC